MARYIDADELIRLLEIDAVCEGDYFSKRGAIKCVKTINTADVVPKSEVERLQAEFERLTINMNAYGLAAKRLAEEKTDVEHILSDLKKEIHDKAVFPNNGCVSPYINLKVLDAVIQKYIDKIKGDI